MTAGQIFSLCGDVALAGWLILIFAGRMRWAAALVSGAVIPLLLAVVYTTLLISHWGGSKGGFGSLAQVSLLFSNPWILLAGWVHYLAFDLFTGSWEVRDSVRHGIPHLVVAPCLFLTFLFGPLGFLLYFVIRTMRLRSLRLEREN